MIKLIGFTGPIGSGKDTLAKEILRIAPYGSRVKFADKMYAMANALDPVIDPDMSHEDKEGWLLDDPELGTRRSFMQQLGTEFGRECLHQNIWVKATDHRIQKLWEQNPFQLIILTDVRFPNEADYVRRHGLLIHLLPDWINPAATEAATAHASETGIQVGPEDIRLPLVEGEVEYAVDRVLTLIGSR